jgi:hypothetical protein
MGEDDHKAKGMIQRFGDRRRARLAADSAMSFKKFTTKMVAITASLLFDSLVIPSIFQSFGLLTRGFAVPIGLAIILAVALQVSLISRIK